MARNTGDPITVYDNASIAKYGLISNALGWPHKDLHLVNDTDVKRLISIVLNQQKDDFLGISEVDLDADQLPTTMFGVMSTMASKGIGLLSEFDVDYQHVDGSVMTQNVHVIGMHGTVSMEGKQAKFTMTVRTAQNQGPSITVAWMTATVYTVGQVVTDNGVFYQCILGHTSGTDDDEPGVGAEWMDFWESIDAP